MLSYRAQLAKIGVPANAAVSYKDFDSRPKSLRQAMRSMDAPAPQDWQQASSIFRDEFWTDEVQGLAWNGSHWIFSCNANQAKPDVEDKALYVFAPGASLTDGSWTTRLKYKDVPHPIPGMMESDDHWGQLTYYEGHLYVSHFWSGGPLQGQGSVVVFESSGANLTFKDWIELDQPTSSDGQQGNPEFQGINPWDGMFYSSFAGDTLNELFKHDPKTGKFTGESIQVQIPFGKIQGACFSPNGHIYIASDATLAGDERFHTIPCYSALNGYRFGVIPVDVEGATGAELEGICHANISFGDGRSAQIHTIVLENPDVALDNIHFKSLSASNAKIV